MAARFFSSPPEFILDSSWPVQLFEFERYGKKNEMRYRNHHESGFNFRGFNQRLIEKHTGRRRMIAFDPSFVPKSGKHTPGVGYFWSGCAGKSKWGSELCGFAAVDIEAYTALHYFAAQTLKEEGQGPMDFYCSLLKQQAPKLLKISKYLGVVAYFSKKSFIKTAIENDLHLQTRLRDDAILNYRIKGPKGDWKTILHQSIALQVNEAGKIQYVLCVHSDITFLNPNIDDQVSFIGLNGEPTYYATIGEQDEFQQNGDISLISDREKEIIMLLAAGLSSKQIGGQLFISPHTVDTHRRNLLKKMGVQNTLELVAICLKKGLI
jgi:DNA-binding CsgD family transcriptional regulator